MWDASQRHNVAVSVHLRSRASGQAFWICTYHMYVLASKECESVGCASVRPPLVYKSMDTLPCVGALRSTLGAGRYH